MNSKYLIAGIGSIIFFNLELTSMEIYIGENIRIVFYIFVGASIILIGLGVLEFYSRYRGTLTLITFILALTSGSFLIISYTILFQEYYFSLLTFNILCAFFIFLSTHYIIDRSHMKNPNYTLVTGILVASFGIIYLIIQNIYFQIYIDFIKIPIVYILSPTYQIILLWGDVYLISHSLLFSSSVLIGILYFMESKEDIIEKYKRLHDKIGS